MSIIVFILILALLVLVHEFGHFIAAKKNGVKVEEFGFGFPPRLFGIKKGGTLYSINALPIGGFVKLYGEEYAELDKRDLKSRTFVYKHPFQKSIIIVAGVICNFLLGWILISYLFTQGVPTPINKVAVEKVLPSSPAMQAGLQEKDLIYKIMVDQKSYDIRSSNDLISLSKKFEGKEILIFIERNGKQYSYSLTPRAKPPQGEGPLGIVITSFTEKKYPWYQAPFYGLIEAFNITKKIAIELVRTIVQVATFNKPSLDVAGPVGIARYTGQAIKFGRNAVLELIALLSLNLAIVNILPFPALDGGRLVFVLYEWVTKKRVNHKVEQYVNLFGIFVLLSLAGLITINDIIKLLPK
ncbi:site-2 protease family protein [Candidatus Roizmanbacteria bacterium]|nr:site-2 protease family protein [Candidatus Roizmanbacteria bacterium]